MLLVETVFLPLVSRRHRNEGEIFKIKLNDADGLTSFFCQKQRVKSEDAETDMITFCSVCRPESAVRTFWLHLAISLFIDLSV